MKVGKDKVVELSIIFYDSQGQELGRENCSYLHGGYGDILPKIEEALERKEAGHEVKLYLEPQDAFGDYKSELVYLEPRNIFPEDISEGMIFEGVKAKDSIIISTNADVEDDEANDNEDNDDDNAEQLIFIVQQVTPTHVLLDANPQWAGMSLQILCKIKNIRPASFEELTQESANEDDEEFNIHDVLSVSQKKNTIH